MQRERKLLNPAPCALLKKETLPLTRQKLEARVGIERTKELRLPESKFAPSRLNQNLNQLRQNLSQLRQDFY